MVKEFKTRRGSILFKNAPIQKFYLTPSYVWGALVHGASENKVVRPTVRGRLNDNKT